MQKFLVILICGVLLCNCVFAFPQSQQQQQPPPCGPPPNGPRPDGPPPHGPPPSGGRGGPCRGPGGPASVTSTTAAPSSS